MRLGLSLVLCAACHAASVAGEPAQETPDGPVISVDGGHVAPPPDAAVGPADAAIHDAAPAEVDAEPGFDGTQAALPADVRALMTGRSWRAGCPVGLDDLALLDLPYFDFTGARQRGQLVVAASVAPAVLQAFAALYTEHFPIARMQLVDAYEADDDRSMADDNTSAFNCRATTGGSSWSAHSYGTAIDVNPRENPYVKGQTVLPPEGAEYLDRTSVRPGMAVEGSAVVIAFDALGWGWGGRWTSPKDHQHFSADDR